MIVRTETDRFEDKYGEYAIAVVGDYDEKECICISSEGVPWLTKDQTRQFAMQLLEMCGEPEAAEQPDFKFVKESD